MSTFVPIAAFEHDLDTLLNTFVTSTSASIAGALGGIAAAGLTIYFMFMSYAIARGEIQEPMSKLTKEVVNMTLIAVIATAGGVYQNKVVGAANEVLGLLTKAVTQSSAKTVGETIDLLWTQSTVTVNDEKVPTFNALWIMAKNDSNSIGIPNLSYFVAAVMVWIAAAFICICCLLPALLAKIGMSLMLAVGPLFIMLAIIPYTRNYFASWLSSMLGNLMTLVLVSMICSASTNIFRLTLEKALKELSYTDSSPLALGLNLIVIAFGLGLASLHVSQQGAQLAGGGLALDTKGLAGAFVQSTLMKSAMDSPDKKQNESPNTMQNGGSTATPYSAGKRFGQIFSGIKRG